MTSENLTYDDLVRYTNVSRETFTRLQDYVGLLRKWQKTINLISKATVNEVWTRHIIDSTQLINNIRPDDVIADLGSGAGFPGLVIAILGIKNITLIESDRRKIEFLKEAARITNTQVIILHKRAEETDMKQFTLLIARGFAPLLTLLNTLAATLATHHRLLLLKGKTCQSEIEQAQADWSFDYALFPSITDAGGVILSIQNPRRLS